MAKTPRRKLKDKLERLVKDYVKQRDNNTCQYCGKRVTGSDCHASHVIPVSRDGRLAYEPDNLKVLCMNHHLQGWHLHPIEFGKWFTDKFPERWEKISKMHQENQSKGSIPISWYREQIEIMKNLNDYGE